ncbi:MULTISPECIES: hypothetical protein [unclassified Rathayibacter]|uniref:hypothetical protein n=1 Tax=unclassified Rathayibacter TaxID=2609250 RepID=UPI0012E7BA95|nr:MULTISPECIES: hypothetical protein [unclassified Rathayibacter]
MPVQIYASDFAYELDRTSEEASRILEDRFGVGNGRPEGWLLTEGQAAKLQEDFPPPPQAGRRFDLPIGKEIRRRSLLRALGGSWQNGIAPSASLPEIFAFTNPKTGARFGYDQFEGVRADGSYAYTGDGQRGDQSFGSSNAALRDAAQNGKAIRLFKANGPRVTYIGVFTNGTPNYVYRTIRSAYESERRGIIFNLLPLDADLRMLSVPVDSSGAKPGPRDWVAPNVSDIVISGGDEALAGDRVVTRVEFELQRDFGHWLIQQGTPPSLLSLSPGSSPIQPDLYVESRGWIVEAKKSTARSLVRMAIGQVLDYAHVARRQGYPAAPLILLPGRPDEDMVDLIRSLSIITAIRTDDGFQLIDP